MSTLSLLGATTRIEVPYIKVTFGDKNSGYTFGVYQQSDVEVNNQGVYSPMRVTYPNYINRLTVQKINGQVNQYSLNLTYVIRPGDDPNFFEKIFSSISRTRKIYFTYGDANLPNYVYKEEEAIITGIGTSFDPRSAKISYDISAISSVSLGYSGSYYFPGGTFKPSDMIKQVLYSDKYGLSDLLYGMKDKELVEEFGLIPGDDQVVKVQSKTNMSALDYIKYLTDCMIPSSEDPNSAKQKTLYIMTIHDEINSETTTDISGSTKAEMLGGPYLKISKVSKNVEKSDAYEILIGFPTANLITNFSVENNENYSIYYDYQGELSSDEWVMRLGDDGEWHKEFAPVVSSNTADRTTRIQDKTWWSKLTQYPISATVTIKGLIKPATLMEYVRLRVLFFGEEHIASGLYIVTKQTDSIDRSGYRTTLNLTRIDSIDRLIDAE